MTLLQTLIERRASVWNEAQAHLDTVEAEGREFTTEADETWTRLNDDITGLDARIAELDQVEQRNAAAAEVRARYENVTPAPDAPDTETTMTDTDVLRSMVNGERRAHEFRDLTVGAATAGGNTVPTGFLNQLMEHMTENSAIRRTNVSVITTDSGNSLQVPKTTSHPTAAIIGEGALITESDPVVGQVTLDAYKYGFSTQISAELEQDTGVDLTGYLAEAGGRALANGAGAHFITGTGTAQPNGVVNGSTLGITGATAVSGAFTADNLIDLFFSVIGPYRTNGSWLMSDIGMRDTRKLKDGNNQYLWAPGLTAGEQSTILGRPVVTDTNVADPALSAKSVVFGDLSKYMIRDVRGVRVERSVDFAFQNDLITWRFLFRTDGDLIDTTGAVKHFAGGAT